VILVAVSGLWIVLICRVLLLKLVSSVGRELWLQRFKGRSLVTLKVFGMIKQLRNR
jgi:hypothetical protein